MSEEDVRHGKKGRDQGQIKIKSLLGGKGGKSRRGREKAHIGQPNAHQLRAHFGIRESFKAELTLELALEHLVLCFARKRCGGRGVKW